MRIAIVGSGISGLTSGYLLSRKHDITVYEANDYQNDWDGTNNDGDELPDGTYYVVFDTPDRSLNNFIDLRR